MLAVQEGIDMTSLPILSSAPDTAFVHAEFRGPYGSLHFDGNQKITGHNGTYEAPKPNAFSLVQVLDCPGATPTCIASCYVHGLEKHAGLIHSLYKHNSSMIRRIIDGHCGSSLVWAERVADWITANAPAGFRWHVSGDVFSADYAHWIAMVCRRSPKVNHWIYTRSFEFVPILVQAENLSVNISADRDNIMAAGQTAARYGLRLCYMTTSATDSVTKGTFRAGDVLFPDYSLRRDMGWFRSLTSTQRKAICPVDFFGKSRSIRCGVCKKCLTPNKS
jgi:hypothetical protein